MKTTQQQPEFVQRERIGCAGSFFNQLMANNASRPVVGEGVTILHYTDRSVAKVVSVSEDGSKCRIQNYRAQAKESAGGMGHQDWDLLPTDRYQDLEYSRGKWRVVTYTGTFTKQFREKADAAKDDVLDYLERTRPEVYATIFEENRQDLRVVEGITRRKKQSYPIRVVFGRMHYYYDWEF